MAIEGFCQTHHAIEGNVVFAPLNAADECPLFGQTFQFVQTHRAARADLSVLHDCELRRKIQGRRAMLFFARP